MMFSGHNRRLKYGKYDFLDRGIILLATATATATASNTQTHRVKEVPILRF